MVHGVADYRHCVVVSKLTSCMCKYMYGGWAKGIPRNWSVKVSVAPTKVAWSRDTMGMPRGEGDAPTTAARKRVWGSHIAAVRRQLAHESRSFVPKACRFLAIESDSLVLVKALFVRAVRAGRSRRLAQHDVMQSRGPTIDGYWHNEQMRAG